MLPTILCLFMLQSAEPGTRNPSDSRPNSGVENPVPASWAREALSVEVGSEEAARREALYEEQELVKRFNVLSEAMREFAMAFNKGDVVNIKKVQAVSKALRDLQKSEWFRSYGGGR